MNGENSEDECCLCGRLWDASCTGWPLCDTANCPNVCCSTCSQALIVSDMFYCPICSGSGESAAATVGGAIATAVSVCSELESLPLSRNSIQGLLKNLLKQPDNPKYRKLRLNNKKVKELLDLDPCRRLLTMVGFTEQELDREPVLMLEGSVNVCEVRQLLDILEGLSDESETAATEPPIKTTLGIDSDQSKRPVDSIEGDTDGTKPLANKEAGPHASKKPKTGDK
ncbi:unnamed protein product [Cylindrotheca closterium]|uniref:PUB domain-containing protein n=1 Tax=Cylindrotheca closterium TaxID=2856 RepID=A0AAD2GDK7_9STRA|nr:unnamed protein product [Cylindrotheca closterium]